MGDVKRDGGPAFPVKGGMVFYVPEDVQESCKEAIKNDVGKQYEGMSLRDWYAGMALQGIIGYGVKKYIYDKDSRDWAQVIAVDAYKYADAMLKQRGNSDG